MKIYILINGRESVRLSNVVSMRHERGAEIPHCKTNVFLKEPFCTKSALFYFFIYTFCTSTLYLYIKPSSHFVQCTKKSKKKIGFFCTLCFFRKP